MRFFRPASIVRDVELGMLAATLLAVCVPAVAAPYELGQGYVIPGLGLTAGGYLSVQASNLDGQKARASLQDLSFLLHGDMAQDWHFFSEVEVSNPVVLSGRSVSTTDADFDFERLYVDYNLTPRQTLRIGKFLTPVGRWNQIHADPLVWTVSRPLTTASPFARNASGMQLYGSWPLDRAEVDYAVFLDDSGRLDPSEGHESTYMELNVVPNPDSAFKHGGGARLLYRTMDDDFQLGVSVLRFRLKQLPNVKDMIGVDAFYAPGQLELSSEVAYRRDESGTNGKEWGAFVQAVYPLLDTVYAVAYHERYKSELFPGVVNSTSVGLTYRPSPPVSYKLEYRGTHGQESLAPDGWMLSFAVLF